MLTTFQTKFKLRDYQERAVRDIVKRQPGGHYLYAGPTGCGKSIVELESLSQFPDGILVTPRLEIIAGMLDKQGVNCNGFSDAKLAEVALEYRITTPIRFRNKLAKGELDWLPNQFLIDEAHHSIADTYQDVEAFLPGRTVYGFTATPYRGTPRGTKAFMDMWQDEITWIITLAKAAERGVISVPTVEIWPLIDDDLIKVVNGEFQTEAIGDATKPKLDEIVKSSQQFITSFFEDGAINEKRFTYWDKPTMYAVGSTDLVKDLVDRLNRAGLPAVAVIQDTPRAARNRAFADCMDCKVAVVQIDVVSEGVDFPFQRLIDLRSTMSPNKWMQQVGRLTRPGLKSEYICCNRNLERHAYLFDGLIPSGKIGEAQVAFAKPTNRSVTRAIGLEGVGRFQAAEVELADGCTGQLYTLYSHTDFHKTEWAVLLHPAIAEPLVAYKQNGKNEDGTTNYKHKWIKAKELPSDLKGFASTPPGMLTDKMAKFWDKCAGVVGIQKTAKVNRKNFQAMPVLLDTNSKFQVGGW
jgi:superfamily II DNA or RNA helicase